MAKPTGFLEFDRTLPADRPVSERIQDWDEFHHHLPEQSLVESNRAVRRLRRAGYNIFAISPSGREVCFIYRGRR